MTGFGKYAQNPQIASNENLAEIHERTRVASCTVVLMVGLVQSKIQNIIHQHCMYTQQGYIAPTVRPHEQNRLQHATRVRRRNACCCTGIDRNIIAWPRVTPTVSERQEIRC